MDKQQLERGTMSEAANPDVWHLIFTQTPLPLRWALGFMTLGLFTLAGYIYRRRENAMQRSLERVEHQVHSRISRMEEANNQQFSELRGDLNHRLDEVNKHLIAIARNTRREN